MFFIPFCVASSAVFISSLYSPRSYTASVRFEIRTDPVSLDLSTTRGASSFRAFSGTLMDDLKSEEYMSEVVDNLGLTKDFARDAEGQLTDGSKRRRAGLARGMASRLQLWKNIPEPNIIQVEITYTGPDSTIGRDLVDEVKKTYARRSKLWIRDYLVSQRDFYAHQLQEAKGEFDRSRAAERDFRLANPFVDPKSFGTLSVKLSGLESERRNLLLRQREHQADLSAQRKVLATLGSSVTEIVPQANDGLAITGPSYVSVDAARLEKEIGRIDGEIERLRSTRGMTDLHPAVIELRVTRENLKGELSQQRKADAAVVVTNTGLNDGRQRASAPLPVPVQQWHIDRAQVQVGIGALEEKLGDITRQLVMNTDATTELEGIEQNVYEKQDEFSAITERTEKAYHTTRGLEGRIDLIAPTIRAADQDRLVHFVDTAAARGSSMPIAPRAKNVVVLSLIIGCAFGAIFVILAEVIDHVYRSSGQVAKSLGLPILEAIDEIVTAQDRRRLLIRRAVYAPLMLACSLGLTITTASMAYLSLNAPATYERLMRIPRAAVEFVADTATGFPADNSQSTASAVTEPRTAG